MRAAIALIWAFWIIGVTAGGLYGDWALPILFSLVAALIGVWFRFSIPVWMASIGVCLLGASLGISYAKPVAMHCEPGAQTVATLTEIRGMYATHTLSVFMRDDGCSLLVYAPRTPVLIEGARVRIEGEMQSVDEAFAGLPGYRKFLHDEGITLTVRMPVLTLEQQGISRFSQMRLAVMGLFGKVFAEPDAGILVAMMVGDRGMIPRDITTSFQQSGITHILSISGFHVSLIAGVLMLVLLRLPFPSWLQYCVVLTVLWMYIIAIGLQGAAVRAGVFWTLLMVAYRAHALMGLSTVIILTVACLFAVDPLLARSIGFQLSVMAVAGIGIAAVMSRRLHVSPTLRPFVASLIVSLGATVTTLPLTAYYFGSFSLIGIVVNIIAIPLVALMMYCALVALALYVIFQPVGLAVSYVVHVCMTALIGISRNASAIPYGSFQELSFPLWAVSVYYVVLTCAVIVYMRWYRISLREIWV